MYAPSDKKAGWIRVASLVATRFWFKCFGTTGFTLVFFSAYLYLLKHPVHPVTVIPETAIDRLIGFEPLMLPFYLSLWLYVSLPPMLMQIRKDIVEYGLRIGSLCLAALVIFYFWPSAVPPSDIDWTRYPGMAFLKGMDASGNACPSLHVATAVFSCYWLNRGLRDLGFGKIPQMLSTAWCAAIVYSTMETRQHMAIDVAAGILLALFFVLIFEKKSFRIDLPFLHEGFSGLLTMKNLLIATGGAVYLAIGFIASTESHPPLFAVLLGLFPLATAALASAWKSKARAILLPAFIAAALAIALHPDELRDHAAWLYFLQHAGAMTLLGITFGATLASGHRNALCSRIAGCMIPEELDANYLFYTWKVTLAWTCYFAASATISALLFFLGPIEYWSIFANFATPVSLGAMFAGEYLIRLRALPDSPKMSLSATIQAYREFSQRRN